jgi:glycerol-1-phosphate dehydrogenase [NAD(P)+]
VAGYHTALPTGISEVVVCDLGVMSRAPRRLFIAGLGDLLAKFIARLDWDLSRIMTGERFCPTIADFALGSARKALEAARELSRDRLEATRTLADAVLVSGFAMQASGGSRPAASAEHTIAHLWEMASAVGNEEYDLHGMLVGAASGLVLQGYTPFYGGLAAVTPDVKARLASYDRETSWTEGLEKEMLPFTAKIREEMESRTFDKGVLRKRLETFRTAKEGIVSSAKALLAELSDAIDILGRLGFPFSLKELGIAEPYRLLPCRYARRLRNRYTSFDLAYELGLEQQLIGSIRS